jgi:hypothetical protein
LLKDFIKLLDKKKDDANTAEDPEMLNRLLFLSRPRSMKLSIRVFKFCHSRDINGVRPLPKQQIFLIGFCSLSLYN